MTLGRLHPFILVSANITLQRPRVVVNKKINILYIFIQK